MKALRIYVLLLVRNNRSKSLNNGYAYNRIGFFYICKTVSRQCSQLFQKLLAGTTELWRAVGRSDFGIISSIIESNCYREKNHVSGRNCQTWFSFSCPNSLSHMTSERFCTSHEHVRSRETKSQRKLHDSKSLPKCAKKWKVPCKCMIWFFIFRNELGTIFWNPCWQTSWNIVEKKIGWWLCQHILAYDKNRPQWV